MPTGSSKTPRRCRSFVGQGLKVSPAAPTTTSGLDVASTHGITGRQAEDAVRKCGITLNRNPIPFDANGPWYTSGLRFGSAAVTTLGMGTAEMNEIASLVALVLKHIKPATTRSGAIDKTKYTLDETVRSQAHKRAERIAEVVSALPGDRFAVSGGTIRDVGGIYRISQSLCGPMLNKHPKMNLFREEEVFLRRWIYDEAHFRDGRGPAKSLQLEHGVISADLSILIAAAIPDLVDQETAGNSPPLEPPAWPWTEASLRARLSEARNTLGLERNMTGRNSSP